MCETIMDSFDFWTRGEALKSFSHSTFPPSLILNRIVLIKGFRRYHRKLKGFTHTKSIVWCIKFKSKSFDFRENGYTKAAERVSDIKWN